jgi:hypothetical protein
MRHTTLVFASLFALIALAACSNVSQGGGGGATGGATGSAATTGSGGVPTGSSSGGGSPATDCATCKAGERCDVLNACYFPPQPYYCIPCDQHPICGSDGKVYESDCAAIAAGVPVYGPNTCATPAGRYACGGFYCDAATEDCERWSPVPGWPEPEYRCVLCSTSSGRACGDDGKVYPDACALLQAGHHRGSVCPGFVPCGAVPCDTTVETCEMGFISDCEGGAPTYTCKPITDAGH